MNALHRRDWERFADASGAGLQQRWSYGETVQALGGEVLRLDICDNGDTIGMAQVLIRDLGLRTGLISRGPVWAEDVPDTSRLAAFGMMHRALRQSGLRVQLCTAPSEVGPTPKGVKVMTPATLALLSLGPNLRKRQHGKWRNRLAAAEGAGLRLRKGAKHPSKYEWLLQENRMQQRKKGFRALPDTFTRAWGSVAPDKVLILTADQGRSPIAAVMILKHGASATYHIGWSNAKGRKASAQNLLLWTASQQLAADGITTLDLGTLDTVNAPGLARFKLGTGAVPVRLGSTRLYL